MKPRNLIEFAYTSEWALAKFFTALFEDGVSDIYNLMAICGREKDDADAKKRLVKEIGDRHEAMKSGEDWRYSNTLAGIRSATYLIERIKKNRLNYFQINNGNPFQVPDGEYDAVIFTTNPTHLGYIESLVNGGHNIICEKPLVIVTDEHHRADRTQLVKLEDMVDEIERRGIIAMDAEHYSAKKATITFYERVGDMIIKYGRISKIEAHTLEKDDPNKIRTKNLLSINNRTGLLLDMGVHLFGVISNIGGEITSIDNASYDIYPGNPETQEHKKCEPYDVETHVETEFSINGSYFHPNTTGKFLFAKFIDRLKGAKDDPKDSKQFIVTFKNDTGKETQVTLDFNEGTVISSDGKKWASYTTISTNEYSNILREYQRAIEREEQPRTSFRRSAQNLNAVWRCYHEFPVIENCVEVYRR